MKAAGSSISLAPTSELRIGFGLPPTTAFLEAGIPVGLSVDTVELVGLQKEYTPDPSGVAPLPTGWLNTKQ